MYLKESLLPHAVAILVGLLSVCGLVWIGNILCGKALNPFPSLQFATKSSLVFALVRIASLSAVLLVQLENLDHHTKRIFFN